MTHQKRDIESSFLSFLVSFFLFSFSCFLSLFFLVLSFFLSFSFFLSTSLFFLPCVSLTFSFFSPYLPYVSLTFSFLSFFLNINNFHLLNFQISHRFFLSLIFIYILELEKFSLDHR